MASSTHEQRGISRRGVLQAAGVGAALLGSGAAVAAGPAADQKAKRGTGMLNDPILHAVRRLSFGPTTALVDHVRRVGVSAWVDEQLHPELIPDLEVERILAFFPTLRMTSAALNSTYAERRDEIVGELSVAAIVRAAWTERQLHEVMVDFWTQHLNVYLGHDLALVMKTTEDREVVRPLALGRFADLLVASAKSPAMLAYLDNWLSSRSNPNENYARELLELHTLGVKGGYTEKDIKNAAKVLTGWTFTSDFTFVYRPEWHATGPVRVMGWSHANADPADGLAVGESMLAYLARHPSTATHIARKLCVRLVKDNPSPQLVRSAAETYLRNDTQIAPVIKHIIASKEWQTSVGHKLRRPLELMAASIRTLDLHYDLAADSAKGSGLLHLLRGMGHAPYAWRTPDGYPDRQDAWLSTLSMLNRWNLQQRFMTGEIPGLTGPSLSRLVPPGSTAGTAGQLVDTVGATLLFQGVPKTDRATMLAALGMTDSTPLSATQAKAATPQLASYLLCASIHQLR